MVPGWKMCNSNKGTGGMESSVVVFKPRIHLFARTHLSVSNSLVCNDWLAYMHQSTVVTSIVSILCFKHVWNVDLGLRTRIRVSNTFGFGSVSGYNHPPPAPLSNTFACWFLVVHEHQSPHVSQTCFGFGPCHAHPSPALFNHVCYVCSFVYPAARTQMKVTPELKRILRRATTKRHKPASF